MHNFVFNLYMHPLRWVRSLSGNLYSMTSFFHCFNRCNCMICGDALVNWLRISATFPASLCPNDSEFTSEMTEAKHVTFCFYLNTSRINWTAHLFLFTLFPAIDYSPYLLISYENDVLLLSAASSIRLCRLALHIQHFCGQAVLRKRNIYAFRDVTAQQHN